jgi:hypothetical protein
LVGDGRVYWNDVLRRFSTHASSRRNRPVFRRLTLRPAPTAGGRSTGPRLASALVVSAGGGRARSTRLLRPSRMTRGERPGKARALHRTVATDRTTTT